MRRIKYFFFFECIIDDATLPLVIEDEIPVEYDERSRAATNAPPAGAARSNFREPGWVGTDTLLNNASTLARVDKKPLAET